MKYLRLTLITLRGLGVICLVGWGLLLFRDNFVNDGPRLPLGIFVALLGAGLGGAYGYAANACLRELRQLKERKKSALPSSNDSFGAK
jgi:hypothetical protein